MTSAAKELSQRAPKTGPWIIGYTVTISALFALRDVVKESGFMALVWVPLALCVAMIIYTSWKRHRLLGTLSAASRAFWRRIVVATAFAFASFAAFAAVEEPNGIIAPLERVFSFLPYVGFAGMIWAPHQYVLDETDEYLRIQAIRQIMVAGFATLIIGAAWSGLASAQIVAAGWVGYVILLWFAGMGIGRLYNEVRP
jgi:hypothetical protein